jgi:hypothetical protein
LVLRPEASGSVKVEAADVKARVHLPSLMPSDRKVVKTGRDAYRAQCPIHGGEHLSFGMKLTTEGTWIFNCWACGEKGDVFSFVMALDRCSFKEALAKLSADVAPLMSGPPPKRKPPALLLACDGAGCGATRELEEADRPYVGRTVAPSWEMRAGKWLCWRCASGRTELVGDRSVRRAA